MERPTSATTEGLFDLEKFYENESRDPKSLLKIWHMPSFLGTMASLVGLMGELSQRIDALEKRFPPPDR
jgi:hypothetical protein